MAKVRLGGVAVQAQIAQELNNGKAGHLVAYHVPSFEIATCCKKGLLIVSVNQEE